MKSNRSSDLWRSLFILCVLGLMPTGFAFAQSIPIGGSYYYCPYSPGMTIDWGRQQTTTDNRPTMLPGCGMPAEYDCPLFESRPQDGLNQAIDALMSVMTITPECKDIGSSATLVSENAAQMRDAIQRLQLLFQQNQNSFPGSIGLPNSTATTSGSTASSTGSLNGGFPGGGGFPTPSPIPGSGSTLPPTSVDLADIQRNITVAMNGANVIGQVFGNSTILNSRCGKAINGAGDTLLAINDVLNSVAPFALAAAATAPGLGTAAKFAITGGSLATSAIATVVNMVNQGSLDMQNPQVRRAVLKNTCLYTKIARKAHFMQLAQSNQLSAITGELEKKKDEKIAAMDQPAEPVQQQITYREGLEQAVAVVETQRRKDNFELSALEAEIKSFQDDELSVCLRAQELVRRSVTSTDANTSPIWSTTQNVMIFPMSLLTNLNQALCIVKGPGVSIDASACSMVPSSSLPISNNPLNPLNPVDPNAPVPVPTEQDSVISSLKMTNNLTRQRLMALAPKVMENDPVSIRYCASITKTWVTTLRKMLTVTGEVVNDQRSKVDDFLSKDPQYATWLSQAKGIRAEEQTISRVARVMREIAKDNSVIDRSELDQRMTLLKSALFGRRSGWTLTASPIEQWLKHTLELHSSRLSSFNDNVRQLQASSGRLRVGQAMSGPIPAALISPKALDPNLDAMTIGNIPANTRGHEIACQLLETTWLDWSAALDHLGASDFMCDMIDDYIDNKVEKAIAKTCRGEIGFDSRQLVPSRLQTARQSMMNTNGGRSQRDWAILVSTKIRDLKCPAPSTDALN